MANLRLFWLEPPAIELDGKSLRLEMRQNLALLAYLSLSPHHPVKETLASLFCPELELSSLCTDEKVCNYDGWIST